MSVSLERIVPGGWESLRRNTDIISRNLRPVKPNARAFNNANILIGNAAFTALTFNSERWDVGSMHSTSVNTGRLTAPVTGVYSMGAHINFAAHATGIRYLALRVNGGTTIAVELDNAAAGGSDTIMSISGMYRLAVGDYVEAVVFQNSGGNLNVQVASNYSPELWAVRLGGYENEGVA